MNSIKTFAARASRYPQGVTDLGERQPSRWDGKQETGCQWMVKVSTARLSSPGRPDELYWPTSEHYFQAQKFVGTPHLEAIQRANTPKDAATDRTRSQPPSKLRLGASQRRNHAKSCPLQISNPRGYSRDFASDWGSNDRRKRTERLLLRV